MKRILLRILFLVSSLYILYWGIKFIAGRAARNRKTEVTVRNSVYNFGKRKAGDTAVSYFTIINSGTEKLFIKNVEPECHCTIPSWPKDPVEPGDSAVIMAKVIETAGIGFTRKLIVVTANSESSPFVFSVEGVYF